MCRQRVIDGREGFRGKGGGNVAAIAELMCR